MAIVAVALATMIWPGDTQWSPDEFTLIANARAANAEWRLADNGLYGTVGLRYGPLATQFYQVLLILCADHVPAVVCVRAALFTLSTGASLLWLTRSLRVLPWLAVLPLLSPFFWFYARTLWDNPFALPLGATLLAAWAAHLRTATRRSFLLAFAAAAVMPLVHPMTLPLVGAVAAHAILFRRGSFRGNGVGITLILIALGLLDFRYFSTFNWSDLFRLARAPVEDVLMRTVPRRSAVTFPLLSGRLLSGWHFIDARGAEPGLATTAGGVAVSHVTTMSFAVVWIGIAAMLVHVARHWRERAQAADVTQTTSRAIAGICLTALAAQMVVHAASRVAPFAHYYCGTWAAAVVCLWFGFQTLRRVRLALPIGLVLAASLITCTAMFAIDLHHNGRGLVWHGPTYRSAMAEPSAP